MKEVKFGLTIGENDYKVKINNIKRFFEKGSQVKVTIIFKGREIDHPEVGLKMLLRVKADIAQFGNTGQDGVLKGKTISVVFSPYKK